MFDPKNSLRTYNHNHRMESNSIHNFVAMFADSELMKDRGFMVFIIISIIAALEAAI